MRKILSITLISLCFFSCKQKQAQEESLSVVSSITLYNHMDSMLNVGIGLGHQDDLSYGHMWYNEPGRSDVQQVTGRYPAVFGWDIGHLELGSEYNLDSVYFCKMKRYIREAHQMGAVNTISWHADNILTGGSTWDCDPASRVVASVLPGGQNHENFLGWLDKLADFFLDLKDDNGQQIPVVFRMYHEHNGGWFWWGGNQCTPEEYKQMWIMTFEHLRNTRQVQNLLYAYSPNAMQSEADFLERYPGDEYVDIIGFDCYANGENDDANPEKIAIQIEQYKKTLTTNLDIITAYAEKSGKIPAITETGMERIPYPFYFTDAVYNTIKDYKVSYVLFWRNAFDRPNHFYVPYPDGPGEEDFRSFVSKSKIVTINPKK